MNDLNPDSAALILAGGDLQPHGAQHRLMRGPFRWVIGVDGGARHALTLGLSLTLIVGDMDSITDDVRHALVDTPIELYPADKDKIDSHLAVAWALDRGAQTIVLAGGIGSRLDQSLANAYLLCLIQERGAHGVVTDGRQAVYLLHDRLELDAPLGTILSVLPIGSCRGLTMKGLRWPLERYDLDVGDTRTISNEFTGEPAILTLQSGRALVMMGPSD